MSKKDKLVKFVQSNKENITHIFKIPTKLSVTYYILFKQVSNLNNDDLLEGIGFSPNINFCLYNQNTVEGLQKVGVRCEIP